MREITIAGKLLRISDPLETDHPFHGQVRLEAHLATGS